MAENGRHRGRPYFPFAIQTISMILIRGWPRHEAAGCEQKPLPQNCALSVLIELKNMLFKRSREKELKMIWEVEKESARSHLVGTAHFFPHSFKTSLTRCLENARIVMFEGPLDEKNMARVVNSGLDTDSGYHLFDDLDRKTIDKITRALAPPCRGRNAYMVLNFRKFRVENPLYDMVKGMKPWLAFFTIWSNFLKTNGWKYSVDLEAFTIAEKLGKRIEYLETIEDQIGVLESLTRERIVAFLKRVDQWHDLASGYADYYLAGNLDKLRSSGLRFPSRHRSVINHRDKIFFDNMLDGFNTGNAVAFVGAPHVRGMSKLLHEAGFRITGPEIPDN